MNINLQLYFSYLRNDYTDNNLNISKVGGSELVSSSANGTLFGKLVPSCMSHGQLSEFYVFLAVKEEENLWGSPYWTGISPCISVHQHIHQLIYVFFTYMYFNFVNTNSVLRGKIFILKIMYLLYVIII